MSAVFKLARILPASPQPAADRRRWRDYARDAIRRSPGIPSTSLCRPQKPQFYPAPAAIVCEQYVARGARFCPLSSSLLALKSAHKRLPNRALSKPGPASASPRLALYKARRELRFTLLHSVIRSERTHIGVIQKRIFVFQSCHDKNLSTSNIGRSIRDVKRMRLVCNNENEEERGIRLSNNRVSTSVQRDREASVEREVRRSLDRDRHRTQRARESSV
ncbi:hypothetical protein PR048_002180 [Dryococelus australis]|uniref:Uncharacterized protein n=1 Tax=Dryococelus australis TaxID=614101 RepID=A0ABQ9IJL0_9NEOP|nr:hypothetical protein PR048_002180 [Dryococelus australis]